MITHKQFWNEVARVWHQLAWMEWEQMDMEEQDMFDDIATYLLRRDEANSIVFVDEDIVSWSGFECRARCGCCDRFLPKVHRCSEGVMSPVFYNTPIMGCEQFNDNGGVVK